MGKRTKNNHYLSQCISKNFMTQKGEPFWEYDFGRKMGPQVKGIERLFAGRRLWGQELEKTIGAELENQLSGIISRLASEPINRYRHIDKNRINELEFNGYVIESREERRILSKLILQTFLMQRNNVQEEDINADDILRDFFHEVDLSDKMNVCLSEINPLMCHPPLILLDGMLFLFIVPEKRAGDKGRGKDKKVLGHICFMFPISTERFLLWGNKEDMDYFALRYRNIDYLNLCRIEQQGKRCRAATQDKQYLESLIERVPRFDSGEREIRIRMERGREKKEY